MTMMMMMMMMMKQGQQTHNLRSSVIYPLPVSNMAPSSLGPPPDEIKKGGQGLCRRPPF